MKSPGTKVRNTSRRQWQPTPVLLPGESHGWRSLVGCRLWGRKESDVTERLILSLSSNAKTGKMKVKNTII